jgi:hypothetical protein
MVAPLSRWAAQPVARNVWQLLIFNMLLLCMARPLDRLEHSRANLALVLTTGLL